MRMLPKEVPAPVEPETNAAPEAANTPCAPTRDIPSQNRAREGIHSLESKITSLSHLKGSGFATPGHGQVKRRPNKS